MAKAIYAGSFDPPTKGHEWVMVAGARLFDELVVAVGINYRKKGFFTVQERLEMLRATLHGYANIRVTSFENEYLVDYAKLMGAKYMIRGIRNSKDYEYEHSMHQINRGIDRDIETVYLIPPDELANISSSSVRDLIGPKGWRRVVKNYVPDAVYAELLKKFADK